MCQNKEIVKRIRKPARADSELSFTTTMADVQLLQIEIQNLKDALETSQKKSDRYFQLGAFGLSLMGKSN